LAQLDVLRGLAVLAVVAFHTHLPWSSGGFLGVDIFFVLSGFLITRLLVVELRTTGSIAWRAFEARRVRRLWPALALVIVGTLVLGVLLGSPLDWQQLMRDAAASAVYAVNLRFAHRSVDYFAQSLEKSPYLHLWSLGVEEQFYVAWPLILLGVAYLARRQRLDERRTLGAAIAVLGTLSLVLMIRLVQQQSAQVFFLTPARLWELAAGGLIGLRAVSASAGSPQTGHLYVALGLLPFIGTIFFPSLRFGQPVLQTIAPVAGTALLLEGIRRGSRLPIPTGIASALAWIGLYSYGWYLWHWPLILGAKLFWHTNDSRYLIAASALALGIAVASKRWLEDPIRFRTASSPLGRLPTWGVIVSAIAVVAVALAANKLLARRALENQQVRGLAALRRYKPLGGPAQCPHGTMTDDCVLGDVSSPLVVVVSGDSHAQHWLPALDSAGRALGLKVVTHILGACPPWPLRLRNMHNNYEDTACERHQRQLVRTVAADGAVALVLASSEGSAERLIGPLMAKERDRTWKQGSKTLLASLPKTVRVILVEKSPYIVFDPLACLARNAFWGSLPACDADSASAAESAVRYTKLELDAATESERVRLFRTIGPVCSSGSCRALIGDIPVFRDEHHFTWRYALSQTGRWIPYLRWATGLDLSDSSAVVSWRDAVAREGRGVPD